MIRSRQWWILDDFGWFWLPLRLRMVETSKPKLCIGELPEWSIFLFSVRFASIFLRFWRSYSCYDMPATSSKLLPLRICKPIFSGQKSTTSFPYPATIVGFRMRQCLICGPFRATSKNCLIRGLFKQTGPALGGVHGNPTIHGRLWAVKCPPCFAAPTPKAQTFPAVCLVLLSVDAANWPKVWP